ncbi:proline/serine-rich coiled-coil protein 1 isoform X1 [Suncus etruscus]|uniref:proline/serine-rich coiled-coil protein 1 isoform X1 n=1 Tax=Suncus etruscus TaxID=109475 RepID=UPI002110BBC2|nr:proline/serine-rich coiled-coil protein 1 isoform X1 [Suncus etruscus]
MEELEEDVKFIVDETLDFGGSSPSDSREEEDIATMVTPEKPFRRGLSHRSDVNAVAPTPQALRLSLGPLSPEKLEEILSEANRLAAQLEQCSLQEPQGAGSVPRKVKPSPRRETFVLKDSPVRDLLPTVSSSSSSRSSPHSSNLTPRLGSSDRKGSARALRTSGKKPLSTKRESPTCNLFPASKSPASSPLARSTPTPPSRGRAGPSGRAVASSLKPMQPVLAPRSSTSNSQHLSRPLGTAKTSSRLPVPSAIPRPANRMPLVSRGVPPIRGAPTPESLPARRGLPRSSGLGHRGEVDWTGGYQVPVSQRPNLPIPGSTRSNLQPLRKGAMPAPAR